MLEKVILQCCEGMLRAASDQHPHTHTHLLSTQHHLGELDDFRYCGKHIIYFIFSFHFHNYASNQVKRQNTNEDKISDSEAHVVCQIPEDSEHICLGHSLGQYLQKTNCLLSGHPSKPLTSRDSSPVTRVFSSRKVLYNLLAGGVCLSHAPCVCWSHCSYGTNYVEFNHLDCFPHEVFDIRDHFFFIYMSIKSTVSAMHLGSVNIS